MPSFIPRNLSMQQMAVTSPDYLPAYSTTNCGMQYLPPPPPYSARNSGTLRNEDVVNGYRVHYGPQPCPPPPAYSQHQGQYLNPPPGLPVPVNLVHRLPPIQTQQHNSAQPAHEPMFLPEPAPSASEEKAVGGVSARLDYDLETMADFVANTSYNLFTKWLPYKSLRLPLPSSSYRKWVMQVLSATRLPSSTLFLSLYYLSKRVAALGSMANSALNEHDINKTLTVSLIIGSKFFDDNTFINKSWSEVSGLDVKLLNDMEREWLLSISYHLHLDEEATASCNRLRTIWDEFVVERNRDRAAQAMKLSPIDSSFHNDASAMHPLHNRTGYDQKTSFQNYGQQTYYSAASTTQYTPWNRTNDSPASAPHTGPTTPEYYGLPMSTWDYQSYNRRSMFYGPQLPQHPSSQPPISRPSHTNATFSPNNHHNYGWSTHGVMCTCSFCAGGRNVPYYNNWAPQVVA